ncbi:sprT-like domain-containing protein Spartan, partial [Stegodyphus dumicola]|uniref:sprT-like domain-containing protein Spartan n=1 Tax=Stegodyphus dumicola TaxID=202533 RepID=UPI0015B2013D
MDFEESFFNDSEDELFLKSIDEDLDFAFALSLQAAYDEDINENSIKQESASNSPSGSSAKPLSIVDEQWELIDPNPDIHSLFLQYDAKFFYGKLQAVEVKWSPRMTHCAGVCCYEGRGRLCSIRLSMPLLKLRPRRDLVETLL